MNWGRRGPSTTVFGAGHKNTQFGQGGRQHKYTKILGIVSNNCDSRKKQTGGESVLLMWGIVELTVDRRAGCGKGIRNYLSGANFLGSIMS